MTHSRRSLLTAIGDLGTSAVADCLTDSVDGTEDSTDSGKEVDTMVEEALQGDDATLSEVQRIVKKEAVMLPLYHSHQYIGRDEEIDGIDIPPVPNMARWTDLRFKQ